MSKTYKAERPVGRFKAGDIICDMPDATIRNLLADGVITEVEPTKAAKPEIKTEEVKK